MGLTSLNHSRRAVHPRAVLGPLLLGAALFAAYAAGRADAFRANAGALTLYTDRARTQGVQLTPGAGSWSSVSDRRKKENFRHEDPEQMLERLSRLSIESWNYRSQPASVRHIGPTAQDFYAAFQLGESDTTITAEDMAGASLLAIQALERRTSELQARLRAVEGGTAEGPVRVDTRRRP